MLNRQPPLGYLTFLLLFLPSLVTSVGEARAHGAASMVGVESSLMRQKGHGHTHSHEHEDRHLHNESGSHFMKKRIGLGQALLSSRTSATPCLGERSGLLLRRVYRWSVLHGRSSLEDWAVH